jgi:hypothetical protein
MKKVSKDKKVKSKSPMPKKSVKKIKSNLPSFTQRMYNMAESLEVDKYFYVNVAKEKLSVNTLQDRITAAIWRRYTLKNSNKKFATHQSTTGTLVRVKRMA